MDDYNISTLVESKNEWCARLSNILTPTLIDGITSVFDESFKILIFFDSSYIKFPLFSNKFLNVLLSTTLLHLFLFLLCLS